MNMLSGNRFYVLVAAVIAVTAGIAYISMQGKSEVAQTESLGYNQGTENLATQAPASQTKQEPMEAPTLTIDTKKTYQAVLKTTAGDITIDFTTVKTPITVNNFITLARKKFYDGVIFHRIIDGFMIQSGDPEGTGAGGPGYKFNDEPFEGEYSRGVVAMANAGPNTNGSQFFIMHKDYPLPKNYVIFGKVTSGIETVDKIATAEVATAFGGEKSKPVNPVKITSAEIIEK